MKTISVNNIASKGLAMGRAHIIEKQDLAPDSSILASGQTEDEVVRFEAAVKEAAEQLEAMTGNSDILKAQLILLHDVTLSLR